MGHVGPDPPSPPQVAGSGRPGGRAGRIHVTGGHVGRDVPMYSIPSFTPLGQPVADTPRAAPERASPPLPPVPWLPPQIPPRDPFPAAAHPSPLRTSSPHHAHLDLPTHALLPPSRVQPPLSILMPEPSASNRPSRIPAAGGPASRAKRGERGDPPPLALGGGGDPAPPRSLPLPSLPASVGGKGRWRAGGKGGQGPLRRGPLITVRRSGAAEGSRPREASPVWRAGVEACDCHPTRPRLEGGVGQVVDGPARPYPRGGRGPAGRARGSEGGRVPRARPPRGMRPASSARGLEDRPVVGPGSGPQDRHRGVAPEGELEPSPVLLDPGPGEAHSLAHLDLRDLRPPQDELHRARRVLEGRAENGWQEPRSREALPKARKGRGCPKDRAGIGDLGGTAGGGDLAGRPDRGHRRLEARLAVRAEASDLRPARRDRERGPVPWPNGSGGGDPRRGRGRTDGSPARGAGRETPDFAHTTKDRGRGLEVGRLPRGGASEGCVRHGSAEKRGAEVASREALAPRVPGGDGAGIGVGGVLGGGVTALLGHR